MYETSSFDCGNKINEIDFDELIIDASQTDNISFS